jgi:hypothetical protein
MFDYNIHGNGLTCVVAFPLGPVVTLVFFALIVVSFHPLGGEGDPPTSPDPEGDSPSVPDPRGASS